MVEFPPTPLLIVLGIYIKRHRPRCLCNMFKDNNNVFKSHAQI